MEVIIDGKKYIPFEELNLPQPIEGLVAKNDKEAAKLFYAYEPLCPECGERAVPTAFPPESFGGEKDDNRVVWLCGDMGHCAFSIDNKIKWQKKKEKK